MWIPIFGRRKDSLIHQWVYVMVVTSNKDKTPSPVGINSKETIQLIPSILCYPKFHYLIYKSQPLVSVLNEVTPF
jgi:hypothetical protein